MLRSRRLPVHNRPVRKDYSRFISPATGDSDLSEVEPHIGKWTGRTRGRKPLQSYDLDAWAKTFGDQIEVDDTKHEYDKSQQTTSGPACKTCGDRHRRCEHIDRKITHVPMEVVDLSGESARGIRVRDVLNCDFSGNLPPSMTSGINPMTKPTATNTKTGFTSKAAAMDDVKPTALKMEHDYPQVKQRKTTVAQCKSDSAIRRFADMQISHQVLGKEILEVRQCLAYLERRHASQSVELSIALAALAKAKDNNVNSGSAVLPATDEAMRSIKEEFCVIDLQGDSTDSNDPKDSCSSVEVVGDRFSRFCKETECKRLSRELLDAFTSHKQPATMKRKQHHFTDSDSDYDEYEPTPFTPKRSSGSKRLRRSAFS